MLTSVPSTLMRGGTSKGLFFLASHLPEDKSQRNKMLLAIMGSPDQRQIDGVGGAHPLTSKVAVVSPSDREDADVDYLFLQVKVDSAEVTDSQNCGNILAGVGPFAIEQGLVPISRNETKIRIHLVNTGSIAVATVRTDENSVVYEGDAKIDGVPGTAAPITLDFLDVAGSSCGALLPTGHASDWILGVQVTCIDNGMPVVVLRAQDFGLTGYESPSELESNVELRRRVESIRLEAGKKMGLGDVADKTIPKMTLVAPARSGGLICTRTFIPHRVHEAIGVLGAVSVATACVISGSVTQCLVGDIDEGDHRLDVEHPTGFFTIEIAFCRNGKSGVDVLRSALLRTARKLMQGQVYFSEEVLR